MVDKIRTLTAEKLKSNPAVLFIVFIVIASFGIVIISSTGDNAQTIDNIHLNTSDTILSANGTATTLTTSPVIFNSATAWNQTWLEFGGADDVTIATLDSGNTTMAWINISGQWYHVVNASGNLMYVNATAGQNATLPISNVTGEFIIGGGLTGSVDEVRVYNVSLTPQEITAIYNGGRVRNESPLVGVNLSNTNTISDLLTLSTNDSNEGDTYVMINQAGPSYGAYPTQKTMYAGYYSAMGAPIYHGYIWFNISQLNYNITSANLTLYGENFLQGAYANITLYKVNDTILPTLNETTLNWTNQFCGGSVNLSNDNCTFVDSTEFTSEFALHTFDITSVLNKTYTDGYEIIGFGIGNNGTAGEFVEFTSRDNLTNPEFFPTININYEYLTDNGLNMSPNDANQVLYLSMNENQGTTTYDTAEGNNGTISGATYANDGILTTLVENTDFTRTTDQFTIVNDLFGWSQITASYQTIQSSSSGTTVIMRLTQIFLALALIGLLMIPILHFTRETIK